VTQLKQAKIEKTTKNRPMRAKREKLL